MISKVKGTYDVLIGETKSWQLLERTIRETCRKYNYFEMRTPIIEHSELFHRTNSDADMIKKETYDFLDRGSRKLTLRPEGTAGIVRAYIENKLYILDDVSKIYYIGPNFRYERPQKGRFRQFTQFGIEVLGANEASADAEVITLCYDLMRSLGIPSVYVELNSLGDSKARQAYRMKLKEYFNEYKEHLCADCLERLERNPLRILDCKIDNNKDFFLEAPLIKDYLSEESKVFFDKVLTLLERCNVSYRINEKLVRGLDYYDETVFEIKVDNSGLGSQNTLGGGGRYQNLVKELGGPDIKGIGVAFGLERLIIALNQDLKDDETLDFYVLSTTSSSLPFYIANLLRKEGFSVDINMNSTSFKSLLKKALKCNPKYLIIIGSEEIDGDYVTLKNTKTTNQEKINIDGLVKYMKGVLS